jgi:regulator of RNase E activity RraA
MVGVGEPAFVGGLRVEAGALLHGDESGVVEIPLSIADRVTEVASRIRAAEQEYFAALANDGVGFSDVRVRLAPHQ